MKKLLCLIVLSLLSVTVSAADFEVDTHYTVVGTEASAEPEVVEYFSYVCIHCKTFEPLYLNLAPAFTNVNVGKIHVPWLGGEWGLLMQRAYATAAEMAVERPVSQQIFAAVFDDNGARRPVTVEDVRELFVAAGASGGDFDTVFGSPAVDARVAHYDAMTKALGIMGTPSFVVNRKYKVELASLSTEDEFHELIRHLLALE